MTQLSETDRLHLNGVSSPCNCAVQRHFTRIFTFVNVSLSKAIKIDRPVSTDPSRRFFTLRHLRLLHHHYFHLLFLLLYPSSYPVMPFFHILVHHGPFRSTPRARSILVKFVVHPLPYVALKLYFSVCLPNLFRPISPSEVDSIDRQCLPSESLEDKGTIKKTMRLQYNIWKDDDEKGNRGATGKTNNVF